MTLGLALIHSQQKSSQRYSQRSEFNRLESILKRVQFLSKIQSD